MGTLSHALGWANTLLTWAWLLWFGVAIVVGGIMLARDEWRLHRTHPASTAGQGCRVTGILWGASMVRQAA